MNSIYDVVVVGAGPGGSATAYYLTRHGLNVLLLDKADFPRDKTCGDGLTPRALSVVQDMGLLDSLSWKGCRINGLEIYAPNGRSIAASVPASGERPAFMLVLPRFILDNTLREHAVSAGARFEAGVHVNEVSMHGDGGVNVTGNRNSQSVSFAGRVAVIATGANLTLPQRAGLLREAPATMVAARAYYDQLAGLSDRMQLRFDGVPLPGYAWIFPTSAHTANVGAGYFGKRRAQQGQRRRAPVSPQDAFNTFVQRSHAGEMLRHARRVSPVKGYPLRVDFATAPTYGERILLVGEAAGLVNPLSGEGIDYALESGKMAAEHLIGMFATGDFSHAAFAAYDRALRIRFQSLFLFCDRVRELCFNRAALNLLVSVAARRTDLKMLLMRIVLGDQPIPEQIGAQTVLSVLFKPGDRQHAT